MAKMTNAPSAAIEVKRSPRWARAERAEQYYDSQQYDGLYPWEARKPLKLRKPRIVVPLLKTTIKRLLSFTWGGSRFPSITIDHDAEDDATDDVGPVLDKESGEKLTKYARRFVKEAGLEYCIREASRKAVLTSSCAVILGVRDGGHFEWKIESGKHCTPTYATTGDRAAVDKLEIVYVIEKPEPTASGGYKIQSYWYRRVVDTMRDVTFQLVPYRAGTVPLPEQWIEDPENTVDHGFGFCPVYWLRIAPENNDDIDGSMLIDPELYSMIDRINYGLSSRDRAVEYFSDPQFLRIGVEQGERDKWARNPSAFWDVEKENDVKILEMKGNGQETTATHLKDLKAMWCEAIGVILDKAETIKGDISGVVLEYLYAPMIAVAADLRHDLGEQAFAGIINIAFRIVVSLAKRKETVLIKGTTQATKLMIAAQINDEWRPFGITIDWQPYFAPSATDVNMRVQSSIAAKEGGLITQRSATQYIQGPFSIEDLDGEIDQLETEKAAAQEDMIDMMHQTKGPPESAPTPKNKQGAQEKPGRS